MHKSPKISLITNPAAGRGKAVRNAARLKHALEQRQASFSEELTKQRGHAEELARQAVQRGADTVMVCGGDGTVHEVAQALAGSKVALAPLPSGRCNDFCRYLEMEDDPQGLVEAVLAGGRRGMDLAQVDGRYYCTVGAVGFDAECSRFVDNMRLPMWGKPAYIYAVTRILSGYDFPRVRLTWDEGQYEGPILMAAVANTPSYGNDIRIVPQARADDGLLDVCLIKPASFFRVMGLLPTLLKGEHGSAPEVSFLSTSRITIESERQVEMWADGEPLSTSPLEIKIVPRALLVAEKPEP